ncbi:MAG: hypothetical protein GY841_00665 [FCB group bacterium]|nr:hypothetical protein [FCB group bacterium]
MNDITCDKCGNKVPMGATHLKECYEKDREIQDRDDLLELKEGKIKQKDKRIAELEQQVITRSENYQTIIEQERARIVELEEEIELYEKSFDDEDKELAALRGNVDIFRNFIVERTAKNLPILLIDFDAIFPATEQPEAENKYAPRIREDYAMGETESVWTEEMINRMNAKAEKLAKLYGVTEPEAALRGAKRVPFTA